jgi:hypothetical protein
MNGLSMLFSRRYRACAAPVTIPWFLMDIATYGIGLFTPTILGAIEISGRTRGLARATLLSQRVAPLSICLC